MRQRRQFHAWQFENEVELHLATLFRGPSSIREDTSTSESEITGDSYDSLPEELRSAGSYDATAEDGSDWDDIAEDQQVPIRSFLGQSLVEARLEVKRLLLFAVLQLKLESPNVTAEVAWRMLVIRLLHERVAEREREISITWVYAFGEPTQAHFRSVFESSVASIRALWNEAYDQ